MYSNRILEYGTVMSNSIYWEKILVASSIWYDNNMHIISISSRCFEFWILWKNFYNFLSPFSWFYSIPNREDCLRGPAVGTIRLLFRIKHPRARMIPAANLTWNRNPKPRQLFWGIYGRGWWNTFRTSRCWFIRLVTGIGHIPTANSVWRNVWEDTLLKSCGSRYLM